MTKGKPDMTVSEIAEARSEAMMRLQSDLVGVIEKHERQMLAAQGDKQDPRIVTHDLFNTLANVAIGHLERRARDAGFKEETSTLAAGAAGMFQEACKKIAFYTSRFGPGQSQEKRN